ncbi:inositol 1,4,5-trisphosphate receptor-interacting protein-like 2 [Gadus chalcogrammus]|uniref:inositol 1,4,5-trisphosphate receptor-interacting protein-like 2 n=1 Tax=Gadus chalcogrammus TaxID=1042646 RepID=UPI0024C4121D|nr:inositol 1,4,5-trisphosphate receptor-interacting protein-like 2 [Gadus chalcogrammus]
MIRVYTCNLRVFWPVLLFLVAIAVVLHHCTQTLNSEQKSDVSRDPPGGGGCWDEASYSILFLLFKLVLAGALCFLSLRFCCSHQPRRAGKGARLTDTVPRQQLLDDFYNRCVRLSPHMVGHSKANVAKVVGDLIRAGRTSTTPESGLSLRGDFLQVGSTYEEHKTGSPDCFDILVPLRVPSGLKPQPRIVWGPGGGERDQRETDVGKGEEETKAEVKHACSVQRKKNDKQKKHKRPKSGQEIRGSDQEKTALKREYEDKDRDEADVLNTIEEDTCGPVPKGCMEVPLHEEWLRRHPAFASTFLRPCPQEPPSGRGEKGSRVYMILSASVLRWFLHTMQHCLASVRYSHEQHCRLSLTPSDQCVQLHLTQQPDYICCHISTVVRMIPVFLLGNGVYLVPTDAAAALPGQRGQRRDLWTLFFPQHEQRLLGWKRTQLPRGSCHLKCLQLVKAVRDLGGQALDGPGAEAWRAVLSSYVLKTAWMRLLLGIPAEAWEERHLVARVEDLVQSLSAALARRSIAHLFLGGDGADSLPPEPVVFSKPAKETAGGAPRATGGNLWAGIPAAQLGMVSGRLAYTWTHLHRLIRLTRPPGRFAELGAPGHRHVWK